jgi:NIMA (never in mitosis gene a)-related kinase
MEYADGGDLYHYLAHHYQEKRYLTEKRVWQLFTQVLRGLKVLHAQKILHRDIKSPNVFLTKSGYAKLGDLNVSKILKCGMLHTQTGTPYYASPEVWSELPYDQKSDVWSVGCVLYEMCTLKPPFRAEDMKGLRQKICKGVYQPIPKHFSVELADLVKQMLNTDPKLRPSLDKIIEIPIAAGKLADIEEKISSKMPSKPPLMHGCLLDTIRLPRNLRVLKEMLPKANYQGRSMERKRSNSLLQNEHSDENSKRSSRIISKASDRSANRSLVANKIIGKENIDPKRKPYY